MKRGNLAWEHDFPLREEVEDFAGRIRVFVVTCHEGALGFTVRATEEGPADGYEFGAYSETSPYQALGRVREKLQRGLARRHISGKPGAYRMLHDKLCGRITSDGSGGPILVVDGLALAIEDVASILSSHEGWSFDLQIKDSLE